MKGGNLIAQVVTILLHGLGALTPVLVNLNKDFQIDALAKELLQGLACLGAHLLQCHTLVTYDDTLLRIALHIDYGIDVDILLCLLEGLYDNFHTVRYLLVVIE